MFVGWQNKIEEQEQQLVEAQNKNQVQQQALVEYENKILEKEKQLEVAQDKIREQEQILADQQKEHQKTKKKLKKDLQRERSAREESDGMLQQAQQELQQEVNAREQACGRLHEVEQELIHARNALEEAERHMQERAEQQIRGDDAGLTAACISTASRSELEAATQQFASSLILGRGGFGAVHAGVWRGREVAVKVLDKMSRQGAKEFLREINILGSYQHPNLLPLLGFCISKEDALHFCALIYPRMKCSLQDALARSRKPKHTGADALPATTRLAIACDVAAGLAYLHSSDNKPVILHRDIKSSNILLDSDNRARVADVGLARRMEAGASQTAGLGTFEYMDRAYFDSGRYTPGSDVFSFGVVLLELLTGEAAMNSRNNVPMLHARVSSSLYQQAAGAYTMGTIADKSADWASPVVEQFGTLAMDCINSTVSSRPTSLEAAKRLSSMISPIPQRADSYKECIICMNATRRTRLRPCCHVLYCEGCAEMALCAEFKCSLCDRHVQEYDVGDFNATYVPLT
jgi:hypothetical protein